MNRGIRVLQTLALPLGYSAIFCLRHAPLSNESGADFASYDAGAGNEARTRYLHLGKVALYQMSYARIYMN